MVQAAKAPLVPETWTYRVAIQVGEHQKIVRAVTLAEALRLAREARKASR